MTSKATKALNSAVVNQRFMRESLRSSWSGKSPKRVFSSRKREARLFITKARSASFHQMTRPSTSYPVAAVANDVDARDKRGHDHPNNSS
jgi:hypothetical protein